MTDIAAPEGSIAIDEIVIGDRVRADLGDIDGLAWSMESLGQLQPVLLDSSNGLIAGFRRIEAAKINGWTHIKRVVAENLTTATQMLEAERDENTCRKQLSPTETVLIAERLTSLLATPAKDRQRAAGKSTSTARKVASGKLPEASDTPADLPKPESEPPVREQVAKAVGMSGRTLDKARSVVEASHSDDPALAAVGAEAVAEMDATGKVDAPAKKVAAAKEAKAAKAAPVDSGPSKTELARFHRTVDAAVNALSTLVVSDPTSAVELITDGDFDALAEVVASASKWVTAVRKPRGRKRMTVVNNQDRVAKEA